VSGDRPLPTLVEDDALFVGDDEARSNKRLREITYHTEQIPRLRLLGMTLLAVVALAHCRYILGEIPWTRYGWFVGGAACYSLGSWWVLRRFFARCTALDLGTFFLVVDIVWFAAAIWISGADRSWLVLLLLVRVADQTNTTLRRVLVFLHLSVASYLLVLAAQQIFDHRPPRLHIEAAKLAIVYITGLYVATTARTAERLRRRTTRAIHLARDLIQRLRSQSEALERARAEAERAGRAKTAFLGNIGHELRTPLTAVLGLTELVLDGELGAEQREQLTAVRGCGGDLLRMVNDLLDLARLESGGLELEDEPLDLRRLLDTVAGALRAEAERKGLALTAVVAPEVPALLRGDPERIGQLLLHLGRNAVRFTARGEVTLSARRVGGDPRRAELELVVADTGMGVARDKQAMIFDAFTQVEGSTQRKHGGAGLGLALVSRLARLMNGRVWVDSAPGEGARFFLAVALPVEEVRSTPASDPADHSPAAR
jgi:signal transduction histidine kinase